MVRILHQLGHRHNWNLDCYFDNHIGDGFIFSAYSFAHGKIGREISGYKPEQYLPIALVDLQYYGYKTSKDKGELSTYPFHPAKIAVDGATITQYPELIHKGIDYQIKLGIKKIIIPMRCEIRKDMAVFSNIVEKINKYLSENKQADREYYLTISFTDSEIKDIEWIEKVLTLLTNINKVFDGYYIVCESAPEYKKKVSVSYDYYSNLLRIFSVLKKNNFKIIYGYANWDAIVFIGLVNIDYISIGTFENLRKFDIKRFTENVGGGPSQGWYYSEKLLNMIRSQELAKLRSNNCISLIQNEKNIFSDIILDRAYPWINNGNNRPDVHKNYLLSISRALKEINSIKIGNDRINYILQKIMEAKKIYKDLYDRKVYLDDESNDYHLATWETFLKSKLI
ncbi:MAG: hypothetical protein Q8P10_03250 [bacterium]|nr:hypothetical protein [bacterium]